MKTRWLERACVVLALLVVAATGAHGATFIVTNTADAGAGSLRQAILDANAAPGADTVTFSLAGCPCNIALATQVTVTGETAIAGPGIDLLTIDGGGTHRVFVGTATDALLTITDLAIAHGNSPEAGGAVDTLGRLAMARVRLADNRAATLGGAIRVEGILAIADSFLERNAAGVAGGAVYANQATDIARTTVSGNTASAVIGGVFSNGPIVIADSVFSQNSSPSGAGALHSFGAIHVSDTVFSGNTTSSNGAAIIAQDVVTAERCVFTANTAFRAGAVLTYNTGKVSTFSASTFQGNVATSASGGALVLNGAAVIAGSEFLGNSAGFGGGAVHALQPLTVSGSRFEGNSTLANVNAGGGAIYMLGSALSVANTQFIANSARYGGAIRLDGPAGTVDLAQADFEGNTATGHGGAIYHTGSQLVMDRVRFLRNVAGSAGAASARGGAFNAYAPVLRATNVLLAGNSAASDLGHAIDGTISGTTELLHVTIADVGAVRPGSAVRFDSAGTLTFANSIVANHATALQVNVGLVAPDRVLVWNDSGAPPAFVTLSGAPPNVAGVVTGDPVFLDAANDDFRLGIGSHAVDLSQTFRLATDYEGEARPQGGGYDAGYDERAPGAQSIVFGPLADRLLGTAPFAVSATASSGLAVTFASLTTGVCTVSGATVTLVATGTCTIEASQAGDAFWAPAPEVARGLTVQSPTFSLSVARQGPGSGVVTSNPAGIDCGTACSASFASGSPVTLTASAAAGSVFSGWSGAGCSGTATCVVTMNAAQSVTATFAIGQYALTVTKSGSGSGVVTSNPASIDCGATCGASFAAGSTVVLTAAAQADSVFAGWTGACTGTGSCNVTMDAAKAVNAEFKPATTIPRLANISTRMQVLTGADVLIGGFIIGGSQAKTVVVRARGPSLTQAGVPGALANPVLQLFSGATQIAVNDNWQEAANQAALFASGFAPSDPFEAAILTSLAPGAYTGIVTGFGGGTGVGIIEVFEVDLPQVPLVNIATRGAVLTGADVMIGGFIIQGDAPRTVIIRARGPSLADAGVPGVLANPLLQLFAGASQIAVNDNWGDGPDAAAIQSAGFAPSHALESAIRVTLAPGAYTAIVTGAGGATGVGIIEVFAQ